MINTPKGWSHVIFDIDEVGNVRLNGTPMPEFLVAVDIADEPDITITSESVTFSDADTATDTRAGASDSLTVVQGDLSFTVMEFATAEEADVSSLEEYREDRFSRRVILALEPLKGANGYEKTLAAVESRFVQGRFISVPPFDND